MMRTVVDWTARVISWLVILSVGGLLLVCLVIPRIGGAEPYTILTGSMQPKMPPGTLVVVKPVDPQDISIGNVITYQLVSGEPTVVTHRVVGVGANGKGESVFITQGDANNTPDARQVTEVQVKGRLWYAVPYAGYVNTLINGKERQVTMIAIVSGLLLYAGFMFTSAVTDRLRPSRGGVRRAGGA